MKMIYSLVAILLVITSLTACGTGGNFYTKDDINYIPLTYSEAKEGYDAYILEILN